MMMIVTGEVVTACDAQHVWFKVMKGGVRWRGKAEDGKLHWPSAHSSKTVTLADRTSDEPHMKVENHGL